MRQPEKLSPYEKKILTVFAESYPDSAHFAGGRNLRKGNWERIFPETVKSVENKNSFLAAAESLEERGVVSVQWQRYRKGDRITAIFLEKPAMLYSLLGKARPEDLLGEMVAVLDHFDAKNPLSKNIVQYIDDQLKEKRKLLFQSITQFKDFLTCIELTPELTAQYTIRALSIHLYNDSKYLEKMLPVFDKITKAATGIQISNYLAIERVYPETTICGTFNVEFSNGQRWSFINNTVTLPERTLNEIERIDFAADHQKILSIENKETFYVLSSTLNEFDACVYCSGHLNESDRILFQLLDRANGEIFHFGDLDPEGLLIFDEIDGLLNGRLQPFMMSETVYSRYLSYGYQLAPGALKRLDYMKNEKLMSLAEQIRQRGLGVEQEIIGFEK